MNRMKRVFIMAAAMASGVYTSRTFLYAQTPHTDKQRMAIQANDEVVAARKALEVARQTEDESVLLEVMSKRNLGLRLEAAVAIAALPTDKAKQALVAVLSNEQLWSEPVLMGSEEVTTQALFVRTVEASVTKFFEINATDCDLFDGIQRANLLTKIKANQK